MRSVQFVKRVGEAYRYLISPALHLVAGPGFGCRFEPSCSNYFSEAVETLGWAQGSRLGFKRLLKCHPWGRAGFDPVPEKRK